VLGRAGELEIVEEQAEVVRRIFKEFAQGYTARDIAGHLNADKGRPWFRNRRSLPYLSC
jgi:site-specific DNA recombinase